MKTTEIVDILVKKGYNENHAKLVAENLVGIEQCLLEPLNKWLIDDVETEVEYQGISINKLMKQNKLKYPAAILTIDWIYKDPKKALSILNNVV